MGKMNASRRRVLLVQLPIPPLGPQPIRGNIPLAAGYLKLFAQLRGLEPFYEIAILPTWDANHLGDRALVEAILEREPWLVGFTCYLWNINRTLWIAERLKERRPDLRIVLGGPEVTADNAWVLQSSALDFAVIGEGEQTFADLLRSLIGNDVPASSIDGLYVSGGNVGGRSALTLSDSLTLPQFRKPLPDLNAISSPYLAGILDAADEQMLLLETIRGCVFKCKFCYYPKSYDGLYFLSEEKIIANLRHAEERGAKEVVLLDPTLNQRRDFPDFLRLLVRCNRRRQFTFFGELRAEGITPETAGLLREANFTEVEVGLQSVDPHAQELMDRKNNLRAVERGIQSMMAEGIKVKVDLIVGLPGETVASVQRGMHYLRDNSLYDDVQMFNLAILPGTAFRQEAEQLGLIYQPRPPYYVLQTPTLRREEMFQLMQEAQDVFEMDWDPLPRPELGKGQDAIGSSTGRGLSRFLDVDLDNSEMNASTEPRAQALTLWLRTADLHRHFQRAAGLIEQLLSENPFTTLQLVVEPTGDAQAVRPADLGKLLAVCQSHPTYLDRFYALQPGRPIGAKRLVVVLPWKERERLGQRWCDAVGEIATMVWRGSSIVAGELNEHEHMLV
jgi:radical SAM superfamily enzyme YgiQ (UPF0313 family)